MAHTVAVELFYDGAWHDLVTDHDVQAGVLAGQSITITRGQGDESPALRPASVSTRLDNTTDRYRTSNPESPLYGKAGRNTPLRISVGSSVRAVVKASSWKAGQTRDFRRTPKRGSAWVDVDGAGLAQQVNLWWQKLRSALYREVALSGTTPAEWWPGEDPAGSVSAVSAVGGSPMTPVTTVRYTLPSGEPVPPGGAPEFGQGTGVSGSDVLPSFQQGGTLSAPIRTSTFDGYAVDWVMQFTAGTDAGGTTSADVLSWTESGTYVLFTVNVTKGFVTVFHANTADAVLATSTGSAAAALDPYDGAAHHYRYQVRQDGGDYSATLYVDGASYATADNFAAPGTMPGTVGVPNRIEWNPGEDRGDYMPTAAGHLIVWPSGQLGDQPPIFDALNGRAGERASYRLSRLLTEEGITHYVSSGFDASTPMGPQRVDTLANLLREILSTEDGLLYDLIGEAALFFLSRGDRYNQASALQLQPEDLPFLPDEVNDGLDPHNVVTVAQREGGDYTARDDTGPLGTQEPPDGVGEYQHLVDVNLADEADLPQYANHWLKRGTVDLPRYPRVVVNLAALDASRVADVEAVDIGDVITIDGFRENTIRLHVLGYREVIGWPNARTITFNCAPDQQFDIGSYDERRYDMRSCTMAEDAGPAATSLSLAIVDDEEWSATSAYDLMIAGELVGIPIGGMGARGGTPGAYTQAVTGAVRSKNGIHKTLPAGAAVHVANPGRYAL